MTKAKGKKNGVYKTEEGAKLLLNSKDPKYRKPAKKPTRIVVTNGKQHRFQKVYKRLRPVIGLTTSPYLLVRPLLKRASAFGNTQFDNVFHSKS